MVIALIVLGVIVFLAIDVYVLWRLFGSGNRSAAYGSIPVPGEATLTLPAGRVKLTYQESVHVGGGGESGPIEFDPPADFELTIAPAAGGGALELRQRGSNKQTVASWFPGGPRSRAAVGSVEVEAGAYVVRAQSSAEGLVDPVVLIGS
jgi:hypothetical protein